MLEDVELLAPCGNEENFYGAINYGATAIYMGLSDFSARKNAGNFTLQKLPYFIAYAHMFGVKVYVAVNTVVKNNELEKFFNLINDANSIGVDAFIVQDIFLGRILKNKIKGIILHLSTQAGINNIDGAKQALSYGFSRVILARETNITEIKKIASVIETEVFVQGALCTCLSGHCYMSSFIGGKSGNRGFCRQPCRKLYKYEGRGISDNIRYALSLSDLSLAYRCEELKSAGVKSFKIEGRMRSFEYVCASCDFYSELLFGNSYSRNKFESLKRTYNRGGYTEGLGFGQKKNLISDKIQNHMGSEIGKIGSVKNGRIILSGGKHSLKIGDCFKIINNDEETGNATAINDNGKIALVYKGKALVGSSVSITKDVSLIDKFKNTGKLYPVSVLCYARIGEPLKLNVNGKDYISDYIVTEAKTSAVTKGELKENLRKTDIYPFLVTPKIDLEGSLFIPKKVMNNLRATAYSDLFYSFCKFNIHDKIINKNTDNIINSENYYVTHNDKTKGITVISNDFSFDCFDNISNVVFCPCDYNDESEFVKFFTDSKKFHALKYLYVPAFLNSKDEKIVASKIDKFDGIYCESASGLFLAKRYKKKFFAGIEINVTNNITYDELSKSGADEIALSKELSFDELSTMPSDWTLALGNIKVMSLIYCPFSKECKECRRGNFFTLKDSEGRVFPVRRYKLSECRFEIYNESFLKSKNRLNREIFDFTTLNKNQINKMVDAYLNNKKDFDLKYTNGNLLKGVE